MSIDSPHLDPDPAPPLPPPPAPLRWLERDFASQTKEWEEFCAWAEWFLRHYEVPPSAVPVCWTQHPVVVEELTACWTAWKAAYTSQGSGFGPLEWHESMAKAIERMRQAHGKYRCGKDGVHEVPAMGRPQAKAPSAPGYVHLLGLPTTTDISRL